MTLWDLITQVCVPAFCVGALLLEVLVMGAAMMASQVSQKH